MFRTFVVMGSQLLDGIATHLEQALGSSHTIHTTTPIGGGSINDAFRLDTDQGKFFLKTNNADRHPSMFEAEADGLGRLRNAGALLVPKVIAYGELGDTTFLLLEWIEPAGRSSTFWEDFGRGLTKLHANTNKGFGLDRDNYIGSLEQVNTVHTDWSDLFVLERLEPQVRLARDKERLGGGDAIRFERLFSRMADLFPKEPPALLHGDLWNGNFLTGPGGEPCIIDPAVYYGHREMDIAMSKLFGGFEKGFYTSYNEGHPLEKGWKERVDLCNLYPLMVHVNLFGGSYIREVHQIIARFV